MSISNITDSNVIKIIFRNHEEQIFRIKVDGKNFILKVRDTKTVTSTCNETDIFRSDLIVETVTTNRYPFKKVIPLKSEKITITLYKNIYFMFEVIPEVKDQKNLISQSINIIEKLKEIQGCKLSFCYHNIVVDNNFKVFLLDNYSYDYKSDIETSPSQNLRFELNNNPYLILFNFMVSYDKEVKMKMKQKFSDTHKKITQTYEWKYLDNFFKSEEGKYVFFELLFPEIYQDIFLYSNRVKINTLLGFNDMYLFLQECLNYPIRTEKLNSLLYPETRKAHKKSGKK